MAAIALLVGAVPAAASVGLAAGCGGRELRVPTRPGAVLLPRGLRAPDDATFRGPRGTRFVPGSLHEAHEWGVEPGGGVRATVSGVRLVSWGDSLVSATDRLPSAPLDVVAVPERMGGGFLFELGTQVWRSETWLGEVHPLLRSSVPIGDVLVGLDRPYLWFSPGSLAAFDARTGAGQALGPLPPSPRMGRVAALDAWRAVVIADFRGALATLDAGTSWRRLELPVEPTEVSVLQGALVVRGLDAGRRPQWWEVERDGQVARLASAPPATPPGAAAPLASPARALGPSPLVAAIEDGWPLTDGTALVARDGTMALVRLSDGVVVQGVADAFPMRPARCHAVSLATAREPGAFGFVCGEPQARTVVYRWDSPRSAMTELAHFDSPREVLAFGNGALAARGPCRAEAGDGSAAGVSGEQAWCVMAPRGEWTERVFSGDQVDRARLVVLSDGRAALVRPPEAELATARLTLAGSTTTEHIPMRFPLLHDDVAKALLHGVWLDGFEERRPGILGGWVDAAGAIIGVEVALDGAVRVGEYIRDAGAPVASGRWAFGWTASRRAFETTDGGMTWLKGVEVPDPIALGPVQERACGPIGCIAAGWLKVGWASAGDAPPPPAAAPLLPASRPARGLPPLRFHCERAPGEAPGPPPAPAGASRPGLTQPALVAPGTSFPAFCGKPGPGRPSDQPGVVVEVSEGAGWPRRAAPIAIVYAWGPPTGEWDRLGHREVRWRSLWGSCASSSGPSPWTTVEAAARALSRVGGGAPPLTLVPADEPGRALLVARRAAAVDLVALEGGRAPEEVRRPDGDSFPELESAIYTGGHWYMASPQPASQLPATLLWRLDGATARELGRVPRAGPEARPSVRLARSTSGRPLLGLVVEGRPDAGQGAQFWVVSVDLETGEAGEPEPLAPVDLSGRSVSPCTGDDEGWQVEWPYAGALEVQLGAAPAAALQTPFVSLRLSRDHACVERAGGFLADEVLSVTQAGAVPAHLLTGRPVDVGVVSARGRTPLRCWLP